MKKLWHVAVTYRQDVFVEGEDESDAVTNAQIEIEGTMELTEGDWKVRPATKSETEWWDPDAKGKMTRKKDEKTGLMFWWYGE